MTTYGIKSLRRLQIGAETTQGTIHAATTLLRMEGVPEDVRNVVNPAENVGLVPDTDRQYVPLLGGKIAIPSTPATFEQLPYFLNMGVKLATPTQDGTGTDYIYSYPFPTTSVYSASDLQTYTIEGGDNASAEVMEFCHVPDFALDFNAGEALMLSATIAGRQVAPQSFTGALSLPDVEEILASKGKVYIDDATGTIGTTQVSNTILAMSLAVDTGWRGIATADGNLYFSFIKQVKPSITLDITFEHNDSAAAEKVLYRAKTSRQIRLKFEGNAVGTPGTTYSKKTLLVDLAGKYTKFGALEDKDGDDIVKATFKAGYNSTAALFATMKVINELSALP